MLLIQRISQSQLKAAKFKAPRNAAGVSTIGSVFFLFWYIRKFLLLKKKKKNLENFWFLWNANNFTSCQFSLWSLLLFLSLIIKNEIIHSFTAASSKQRYLGKDTEGGNKEAWKWATALWRDERDRLLILEGVEGRGSGAASRYRTNHPSWKVPEKRRRWDRVRVEVVLGDTASWVLEPKNKASWMERRSS